MAADMPLTAASSAGGLLRLDWRLYRLQCRFDLVPRRSNFRPDGGAGPGSRNNFSTSPSDGIFGFHAGAQWQWGAWVLGAEAALSGCFDECRSASGVVSTPANTFFQHKITNLFTVGPRLGYAWDRFMIFATGGYASANLKTAAC